MKKLELPIVIVANGKFPSYKIPINILKNAKTIIACDGAADKLIDNNYKPDLIIGDLDSVSKNRLSDFKGKIISLKHQSKNDFTKAIEYLIKKNIQSIDIVGATGLREDHQIANIFSIIQYDKNIDIRIYTDYGIFKRVFNGSNFSSFIGQQLSIFTEDRTIKIETNDLKYNIIKDYISPLYSLTLNESKSKNINFKLSHGKLLIFLAY